MLLQGYSQHRGDIMKELLLVFGKIMGILWWIILGITITVAVFHTNNAYIAFSGLVAMSIWVSVSGTYVWWTNEKWLKDKEK